MANYLTNISIYLGNRPYSKGFMSVNFFISYNFSPQDMLIVNLLYSSGKWSLWVCLELWGVYRKASSDVYNLNVYIYICICLPLLKVQTDSYMPLERNIYIVKGFQRSDSLFLCEKSNGHNYQKTITVWMFYCSILYSIYDIL